MSSDTRPCGSVCPCQTPCLGWFRSWSRRGCSSRVARSASPGRDLRLAGSDDEPVSGVLQGVQVRRRQHPRIRDLVVVADAGMLSASNLNALEDAGYRFIVGSRQSQVPYDLGTHFERHGNYTPDGSTIETSRDMGSGKDKRTRRVVYHYSFTRHKRDDRTINKQVEKAEKVAAGQRPIARDRFVTVTADADGKKAQVNWDTIERARFCAGFKGYVTNITPQVMDGAAVAYHDLWHVEQSFRMAK